VCRRIESHFILHGTLVGVVAALLYVALTPRAARTFRIHVAHVLKLVGGACGGFVAKGADQRLRRKPFTIDSLSHRFRFTAK